MSSAAAPLPNAADEARALYEQYGDRIFAFCLSRLGKREEAEDAVQTTFLYVLRGLRRGVEPRFPLAWLFKIAENVCHSRHRADSRRTRHEASRDPDLVATLAAPAHETDELMGLPEALREMPERQRQALLLREWQGLSYCEIGDELGLSQSAVETLLFRARRSLASRLRALDLGAALTFLRSLLKGGGGKVAAAAAVATIGTAAVVLPVVDPGSSAPAPAQSGTAIERGSAPAAAAVDTPGRSGGVLAPAARPGRLSADRPTEWSSPTRARSAAATTTGGTPPPESPGTPPATTPASSPTTPTTPTAGATPSVPSTTVGGDATTPVARAGATISTDDDSAAASASVGAETPAGSVEASAGAEASTSGASGSLDASASSTSVGTTVTVPVPTPPPLPTTPKLP